MKVSIKTYLVTLSNWMTYLVISAYKVYLLQAVLLLAGWSLRQPVSIWKEILWN